VSDPFEVILRLAGQFPHFQWAPDLEPDAPLHGQHLGPVGPAVPVERGEREVIHPGEAGPGDEGGVDGVRKTRAGGVVGFGL
jgi:hypothetical protein